MTIIQKFKLNTNIDVYFDRHLNIFFLKSLLGLYYFYLPSFYFFKNLNGYSFLFTKFFFFKSFISNFITYYSNLNNIFIMRIRIRGLGYQIYKLSKTLYFFRFSFINFFYLFIPKELVVHWHKKKLILLSNNFFLLKLIFNCILILKKLGPYRILGIKYPRQIVMLKKGGKKKVK